MPITSIILQLLIDNATIQWAFDHALESARLRCLAQGVPLVAGPGRCHNNGPGWICSGLSFDRQQNKAFVEVRSHTMHTLVDHPIPFADGKLYMKPLSPTRVLDWMYTDSLRHGGVRTTSSSHVGATIKDQHFVPGAPGPALAPSLSSS
jgi:hypothetical protein